MLMSESLQMTEFSGHKTVCWLAGYEVSRGLPQYCGYRGGGQEERLTEPGCEYSEMLNL